MFRTLSRHRAALLATALSVVLLACRPVPEEEPAAPPPNLLVVLTDDQGQWSAGPYGGEVRTPHLDRMAAEGWVMERAMSPSGVCSPARASLFTGRLPSQHGVHDFLSESIPHAQEWLAGETLLPELLQGAGYRTGLFGKWHATPDPVPPQRGFDRWLSYDVFRFGWQNQYLHRGEVAFSDQGESVLVDGHQAEHLTRSALEFIDSQPAGQPFFAFVGYAEPHAPFAGYPERLVEEYRQSAFSDIPRGETTHLEVANESSALPADPTEIWAQYFAGVTFLDEQLGELLHGLEERGLLENTLVVFASDHGQMMGHHGLVGKANASLPQNLYQETLLIPMVLRWPAGLPGTGRFSGPFDLLDLFQTLLDAAGVSVSEGDAGAANRPGRSVLPKLRSPEHPWRRHQFAEHGTLRTVVSERFKLVARAPPLPDGFGDELYDLERDPRETTNLLGTPEHAEVELELRRALESHFERYTVPGRAGTDALQQPPQNGNEPWRRLAARLTP